MRLPASLSPWAPWLEVFPEPLALTLGSWAARLSLALGSLRRVSRLMPGEPDGYRGLSRRGPYERLLTGEWAIAEAVPEEFLRRAAHGEHLFLELASAEPAGALRSVALFDAGPSQLGGPRIVHIAALIALAQRAEAASASFVWGIVQQPSAELLEVLTPESLQRLLEARCHRDPDEADLSAWPERLGRATASDDRWLIGPPGLPARIAPELCRSFVELSDPYEPGRDLVHAVVRRGDEPAREIEIELPEPRACVQLLRDPFRAASGKPLVDANRVAPGSNLLFSASETRLIARLVPEPGRSIVAYAIPNSPKEPPAKPKLLVAEKGETITAAGWYRQRLLAVASTAEHILIYGLGKQVVGHGRPMTKIPRAAVQNFEPGETEGALQACFFGPRVTPAGLYLTDAGGRLFHFATQPAPAGKLMASDVVAFAAISGQDDYFRYAVALPGSEGRVWICLREGTQGHERSQLEVEPGDEKLVYFGSRGLSHSRQPGLMAVRVEPGRWRVVDLLEKGQLDTEVSVPAGAKVLGVTAAGSPEAGACLVLLEPDRKGLRLQGRSHSSSLVRSTSEIAAVCVGRRTGRIAYRTTANELLVHSLEQGTVVLRVVPEAAT